jgi:uncharacterized protein (TIGR00375 family)
MEFIADFHIHSKYSRATSRDMQVDILAEVAKKKGITLLGTGDFTHPLYLAELKRKLKPIGNGLYAHREDAHETRFILTTEVSNIFSFQRKTRRIHTLIFAPSLEIVEKINGKLSKWGKLSADGRPIFGTPVKDLVRLVLDISPDCFLVPAHAWTPWFSLFGANSGFDSLDECFQEEAKNIKSIETGLSSDPEMNWRLSALDSLVLISNSDAHSPSKIGREANVFEGKLDYFEIIAALQHPLDNKSTRLLYTIEFYPEEGKYHYDGHRACQVVLPPQESLQLDNNCPVCGRKLTIGVMHRVEELADRPSGFVPKTAIPSKHLIPLEEIIAEALGCGVETTAVKKEYDRLIAMGGSEFNILLKLKESELASFISDKILCNILNVRKGKVKVSPGYDGVYGKIKIMEDKVSAKPSKPRQMSLF